MLPLKGAEKIEQIQHVQHKGFYVKLWRSKEHNSISIYGSKLLGLMELRLFHKFLVLRQKFLVLG